MPNPPPPKAQQEEAFAIDVSRRSFKKLDESDARHGRQYKSTKLISSQGEVTIDDLDVPEDVKEFLFDLDFDLSGEVSKEEMTKMCDHLKQLHAEMGDNANIDKVCDLLDLVCRQVGRKKNNASYMEYAHLPENIQKCFRIWDTDGDGRVDATELMAAADAWQKLHAESVFMKKLLLAACMIILLMFAGMFAMGMVTAEMSKETSTGSDGTMTVKGSSDAVRVDTVESFTTVWDIPAMGTDKLAYMKSITVFVNMTDMPAVGGIAEATFKVSGAYKELGSDDKAYLTTPEGYTITINGAAREGTIQMGTKGIFDISTDEIADDATRRLREKVSPQILGEEAVSTPFFFHEQALLEEEARTEGSRAEDGRRLENLGFYAMTRGSCCCPEGEQVLSAEECKIAHEVLGVDVRPAPLIGKFATLPGGCSTKDVPGETSRTWNEMQGTADEWSTPICIKRPNLYYKMTPEQKQNNCCCSDFEQIETIADCEAAHDSLGLDVGAIQATSTKYTTTVGGCSNLDGAHMRWNGGSDTCCVKPANLGGPAEDLTPICKNVGGFVRECNDRCQKRTEGYAKGYRNWRCRGICFRALSTWKLASFSKGAR